MKKIVSVVALVAIMLSGCNEKVPKCKDIKEFQKVVDKSLKYEHEVLKLVNNHAWKILKQRGYKKSDFRYELGYKDLGVVDGKRVCRVVAEVVWTKNGEPLEEGIYLYEGDMRPILSNYKENEFYYYTTNDRGEVVFVKREYQPIH